TRELESAREAEIHDPVRRKAPERTPVEVDGAAIERNEAGEQIEDRGLARAVRPKHAGDGARLQGERDVPDGVQAAEVLVEPVGRQESGHRMRRLTRCHSGATNPCGMKNRMKTSSSV